MPAVRYIIAKTNNAISYMHDHNGKDHSDGNEYPERFPLFEIKLFCAVKSQRADHEY